MEVRQEGSTYVPSVMEWELLNDVYIAKWCYTLILVRLSFGTSIIFEPFQEILIPKFSVPHIWFAWWRIWCCKNVFMCVTFDLYYEAPWNYRPYVYIISLTQRVPHSSLDFHQQHHMTDTRQCSIKEHPDPHQPYNCKLITDNQHKSKRSKFTGTLNLSPFCNKGNEHSSLAMGPCSQNGTYEHKADAPGSHLAWTSQGKQRTHLGQMTSSSTWPSWTSLTQS